MHLLRQVGHIPFVEPMYQDRLDARAEGGAMYCSIRVPTFGKRKP